MSKFFRIITILSFFFIFSSSYDLLAKKAAEKDNAYEPVFINKDNYITECAIRNIFYIKNNELLTPELDLGILPGVMRDTILEIAKTEQLEIHESHINFKSINDFDDAFISSSGIGVLECYWSNWKSDYNMTKKIKKILAERLTNW